MPGEPEGRTMGPVGTPKESGSNSNDLQRALEGELVDFLRRQNSKLQSEVAALRDRLEKSSGMGSSPWSAVDGVDSMEAFQHHGRQGRHGSRTPRTKLRQMAVSPERKVTKQNGLGKHVWKSPAITHKSC